MKKVHFFIRGEAEFVCNEDEWSEKITPVFTNSRESAGFTHYHVITRGSEKILIPHESIDFIKVVEGGK